jgi:transmembrane sensor
MTAKERIWHLFARKLTSEASVEELHELEQLLQRDSSYLYETLIMEQLWNAEPVPDADYLEATYLLHHQKMQKLGIEPGKQVISEPEDDFHSPEKRFSPIKWMMTFMAVVVTAGGVYWWFQDEPAVVVKAPVSTGVEKAKTAVTKNGTRTKLTLPDGSAVWLNAGSKLNYEKVGEGNTREVYLTGEAYFDIVRNVKRPFIIHTSAMDVKVLGTQFNVKAYPDDATVETSLIHGSVQVFLKNNPGKSYLLKPNEKLVLYKRTQETAKKADLKQSTAFIAPKIAIQKLGYINGSLQASETAWTRNMLSFKDEPFTEVALKMERWFDVTVEFKNERLKNIRLTGSFENETLQQAIAALQFSTSFQFIIENNRLLIY